MFRRVLMGAASILALSLPVHAQTVDEVLAKYAQASGGLDKMLAVKSVRTTAKVIFPGGFELSAVESKKRPNLVRQEFTIQGQTAVSAYDGKSGWKIDPFQGKKDPEALAEDELKQIVDDADFDGPLINPKTKGHTVELVGKEPVEGTDAYKLKVTLKSGTVQYYFLDADAGLPIKIETKRMVRGTELEFETTLGDYKEFEGLTMPTAIETGVKGRPAEQKQKITVQKVEMNVPLDDALFKMPAAAPAPKAEEKPAEKKDPKAEEKKK